MKRTHHFILKGDIPSKKNSYRIKANLGIITYIKELRNSNEKISIKPLLKFFSLRPRQTYIDWEDRAVQELVKQTKGNLYLGKVEIWFTIYFPRRGRAGGDTDNKTTSILDAMVKAGIIMDDSYNCVYLFHTKGIYRPGNGGAEINVKDLTED